MEKWIMEDDKQINRDTGLSAMQLRSGLTFTREAIKRGKLTVGFLGGSITDGKAGHNWSDYFINWLCAKYPETRLIVENAAQGATGSDLAVMRVDKQIIEKNCDLVFIEYAVNDRAKEQEYRFEIREGLIRKLLSYGKCDIVLVYTYDKGMQEYLPEGKVPPSVADFEVLAEYYGLSSVWPGLKAFEGWRQGLYQYEEWIPDGLHPQCFGSNVYAHWVEEFFGKALERCFDCRCPASYRGVPVKRGIFLLCHGTEWRFRFWSFFLCC